MVKLNPFQKSASDHSAQSICVGSHISLEHASSVMEAKLAAISPDLRCCQTPPLEPWLGDAAPSFADDAIDLAAEFDELQSSIEQTKAMINVDSTHLLKNAAAALSRAKNSL